MLTGARILKSDSKEAIQKAIKEYDAIKQHTYDYKIISKNTGFSIEQCQIVKNYIFNTDHYMMINRIEILDKFPPDYAIAKSWLRLSTEGGKIEPHDVLLLYHELTEISYLVKNSNISQLMAHNYANMQYDYGKAVKLYELSHNL